MRTRHDSEKQARAHARTLGREVVQIVESRLTIDGTAQWRTVFYVESGEDMGMIRNYERCAYSGQGRKA